MLTTALRIAPPTWLSTLLKTLSGHRSGFGFCCFSLPFQPPASHSGSTNFLVLFRSAFGPDPVDSSGARGRHWHRRAGRGQVCKAGLRAGSDAAATRGIGLDPCACRSGLLSIVVLQTRAIRRGDPISCSRDHSWPTCCLFTQHVKRQRPFLAHLLPSCAAREAPETIFRPLKHCSFARLARQRPYSAHLLLSWSTHRGTRVPFSPILQANCSDLGHPVVQNCRVCRGNVRSFENRTPSTGPVNSNPNVSGPDWASGGPLWAFPACTRIESHRSLGRSGPAEAHYGPGTGFSAPAHASMGRIGPPRAQYDPALAYRTSSLGERCEIVTLSLKRRTESAEAPLGERRGLM